MTIAQKVKQARLLSHLTQHQLAKLCGVTYRTVQHWESGTRHVPVHKLRIVSHVLHLPIDDLIP